MIRSIRPFLIKFKKMYLQLKKKSLRPDNISALYRQLDRRYSNKSKHFTIIDDIDKPHCPNNISFSSNSSLYSTVKQSIIDFLYKTYT